MRNEILISQLNDFIFCPASIYFHMLYGESATISYQSTDQINGSAAHETVDNNSYSTRKDILSAVDVYCEKYGLIGKIDIFDVTKKTLTERKRTVKQVYDGYVFQVYAQYFALIEMGYEVEKIVIHSITDNKNHIIPLPEDNKDLWRKFEDTIEQMHSFTLDGFEQSNAEKCKRCIYEPACDRGIK